MERKICLTYLLLISCTFSFLHIGVYAEEGEYCQDINRCVAAQQDGSARAITEYVCLEGKSTNYNDTAYQVILDRKFQEVDAKIDEFLIGLEEKKDYYFGSEAKESFVVGVQEISDTLGVGGKYYKEFYELCSVEIIQEVEKCSGVVLSGGNIINSYGNTACTSLAETKLGIAEDVAYNTLQLNKSQIQKDQHKLYVQDERSKYSGLIDFMNVNLSYIQRISKKIVKLMKQVYGG